LAAVIASKASSAERARGRLRSSSSQPYATSAERNVSLNVALEADSLSLQTNIVAEGGAVCDRDQ
jgi:hypothetical protein